MAIYAMGDLHLSFQEEKPMNIFGDHWIAHEEKIRKDWEKKVKEDDLVILPGDFSWAMKLEDTKKDFEYLNKLPGKKLLLKGNHDYWWTTVTSMKRFLKENHFEGIEFLYNNSYEFEGRVITGTRGWSFLEEENDKKIIKRELNRLELSLKDGIEKYGEEKEFLVCMHYPPITKKKLMYHEPLEFVSLMKKYPVQKCIYGHLHGNAIYDAVEETIQGIQFTLVSADYLDFQLIKV